MSTLQTIAGLLNTTLDQHKDVTNAMKHLDQQDDAYIKDLADTLGIEGHDMTKTRLIVNAYINEQYINNQRVHPLEDNDVIELSVKKVQSMLTNVLTGQGPTGRNRGVSKASIAEKIYLEERTPEGLTNSRKTRKRFQDEAGLTKAGAMTYYYNLRNKFDDKGNEDLGRWE